MHTSIDFCKKTKKLVFILSSLSILALLSISPAAASGSNWEFSPQEPVSGDTLYTQGSFSPEEEVDVFVSFKKTVRVSGGEFEYTLEDVKISTGLNNASRSKTAEKSSPDEKSVQENKTQLSGKDTQKTESSRISADKLYLLTGMGAGLLILIIYSRRK